jgi:hypothetical protein
MHITKLPPLNTELMAIRQARRATKVQEHIDSTNGLIDDISAVCKILTAWNTNIARVSRRAFASIRSTLESCARCAPWNDNCLILEDIEIGVCRCLDYGTGVLLVCWDWIPLETEK